eukprot:gene29131-35159_t
MLKILLLAWFIVFSLSESYRGGSTMRSLQMSSLQSGLASLRTGQWVKFISGASNQDVPLIRNLCYVYTQVGVDCIDVSADEAVVNTALDGITAACSQHSLPTRPLLMISVNDGEDDHFRKAYFDSDLCPSSCSRPCEKVCPAWAITSAGVIDSKCYGCGRCIPVCPYDFIQPRSYITNTEDLLRLIGSGKVDGIEIHTKEGHEALFQHLWTNIADQVCSHLQVISISFNDMGPNTPSFLEELQRIMTSSPHFAKFTGMHIWQTDGRSMSGDIGKGTIHEANSLAKQVLQANVAKKFRNIDFSSQRHFVQLAGGTNIHSMEAARQDLLPSFPGFGGFAFGGYARRHLAQKMFDLSQRDPTFRIEDHPGLYQECRDFASRLMRSVKEDTLP